MLDLPKTMSAWGRGLVIAGLLVLVLYLTIPISALATDALAGLFGLSIEQATTGSYAVEVVGLGLSGVLLLWRLVWTLEAAQNWKEAGFLLMQRAAWLAVLLAWLFWLIVENRYVWLDRLIFSPELVYDYQDLGAANRSNRLGLIAYGITFASFFDPGDKAWHKPLGATALVVVATVAAYWTAVSAYTALN